MTLTAALTTAARSLDLFTLGIQVAGNNISNANTPGYIRNHLVIEEGQPYRQGNLLIGTGAFATGIQQDVDQYLQGRIQQANGDAELSSTLNDSYQQLQNALQSLGDNDLSKNLSDFVGSLQAAVNQPEDPSIRSVTVDAGQAFADNIRLLSSKVDQLSSAQSDQIDGLVTQVNQLIDTVQTLNPQISQMEANGLNQNDAGSLRNQRTDAINQLSQLINIKAVDRPDGGVDIYTSSDYLILGNTVQHLQTVTQNVNGVLGSQVETTLTHSQLSSTGGQLTGLIESRDQVIQGFKDNLDRFTAAAINEFNKIHASGEGTKGFTSVTGTYQVNDPNAALNAAGLDFPPQNGSFQLKVLDTGTGLTQTTDIPVNLDGISPDTTLTSLAAAINAAGHVNATITADGKLQLSSDAGFEFRFSNDTSGVLAGLGINTFFTGTNSSNIQVNDVLKQDAGYLATGQGGGPSDNRNALQLSNAFDTAESGLNNLSISDFYNHVKSDLAQQASAQSALSQGLQSFRDSLNAQQQQKSGVNLDEELIQILQFQHSYMAAAKIITTVDQLMNTLLQM
jgi:flagellar hook-associated protein 1